MTKRLSCTQAQVRRIIRAAEREGLIVVGIKPDGTILVGKRSEQEERSTDFLELERLVVL